MTEGPRTVTIRLTYLGNLRRHMGCNSEEVVVERPVSVKGVLERLVETHGPALTDLFYNQYGWLDPRLFFLIDQDGDRVRADLDSQLTGTEEVTLMLGIPMSGG
jgi:hypothetical protein